MRNLFLRAAAIHRLVAATEDNDSDFGHAGPRTRLDAYQTVRCHSDCRDLVDAATAAAAAGFWAKAVWEADQISCQVYCKMKKYVTKAILQGNK